MLSRNVHTHHALLREPRIHVGFLDFVSDAFDDVWSAVTSIPGIGDVLSTLGSQFQDFARTSFGKGFLAAVTTYATGGLQTELAGLIGPMGDSVAAVAFALPGVSAGETFGTAWTQEFISRSEQLASIVGSEVAQEFIAEYGKDLADKFISLAAAAGFNSDQITEYAKTLQTKSTAEIQAIADAVGVRADVLQSMIDYASGMLNMQVQKLVPWASLPQAARDSLAAIGINEAAYADAQTAESTKRMFDPYTGNIINPLTATPVLAAQHVALSSPLTAQKPTSLLAAAQKATSAPLLHTQTIIARSLQDQATANAIAAHEAHSQLVAGPVTVLGVPAKDAAIGGGLVALAAWALKAYYL